MYIYDMSAGFIGVEFTSYTDPLNLYKVFVDYKNEFDKIPRIVELTVCDKEKYVTKRFNVEQYTNTNYLYHTDNILTETRAFTRLTNFGWFCEMIQHAYQDFLLYERGVLN